MREQSRQKMIQFGKQRSWQIRHVSYMKPQNICHVMHLNHGISSKDRLV